MKETKLLKIDKIDTCGAELDEAAAILARGGLVAIPTETVYGLAANAYDEAAVRDIFKAKGRPQDNPLIVHIADLETIYEVADSVPESALRLAEKFWPGPLTIILPKSRRVPSITSAGLGSVAVRLPAHPVARELIRRAGVPLAAPSANLSGSPSTTTAQHCIDDLMGKIDAIVDGGNCCVGVESTVLTLTGEKPRLLRPGFVTFEQLREVLGDIEMDPAVKGQPEAGAPVSSPGMKYRHYAPKCRVVLVDGTQKQYADYVNVRKAQGRFALCYNEDEHLLQCPCIVIGSENDQATHAVKLFDSLRRLDDEGAKVVYARCPKPEGVGLAVYNRLLRAASFQVVYL